MLPGNTNAAWRQADDVKVDTNRKSAIYSLKQIYTGQASSQSHAAKTSAESALCARQDYKSLSRGSFAQKNYTYTAPIYIFFPFLPALKKKIKYNKKKKKLKNKSKYKYVSTSIVKIT